MNQLIILEWVILALNMVVLSVRAQGHQSHGGHNHHAHHKVYHPKGNNYTCPNGYDQQGLGKGSQCVKRITAVPKAYCKIGVVHGNKCKVHEPPQLSCPPGYYQENLNSGEHEHHGGSEYSCINVMQVPFEKSCPQGSEVTKDGCVRTNTSPVWMVCPIGSGSHGHSHSGRSTECVEYKIIQPQYSCNVGFTLIGTKCHGSESRPCPIEQDNQHHSHGGGSSGHGHHQNNIPSKVRMCDRPVEMQANRNCPPEAIETTKKHRHHGGSEQTCVIPVPVPLKPYCPLTGGFIDQNQNSCSVQITDDLISKCPAGFSPCANSGHSHSVSSNCCKISFEKPISTCSKGLTLEHSKCLAYYPMERECENGFIQKGDECESFEFRPPINAPVAQVLRKENFIPHQKK